MSELISGKEALIAWYDGLEVEVCYSERKWKPLKFPDYGIDVFKSKNHTFRLKPKTININGIEIEKPKDIIVDPVTGSVGLVYDDVFKSKQVAEILRSVFDVQ